MLKDKRSPSVRSSNWKTSAIGLFALSYPIIGSQFAQFLNGVVDVVMAGRLSVTALGAISTGAAIWSAMMFFLVGLLYAMIPTIGVMRGEGHEDRILGVVIRGLIVGGLVGAILGGFLYFGSLPVFEFIKVSPDLIPDANRYVQLVAFGLPGMGIFLAIRFLTEASGSPILVTITIVFGVLLKIVCNALFVFGCFGAPNLGTAGFGLSSIIVFWSYAVVLLLLGLYKSDIRSVWRSKLNQSEFQIKKFLEFIRDGFPIACNFLSEFLVLTVMSLFIATISAVAVSSHQIAFSLVSALTMIPTGISMAAAILVAQACGQKDRGEVKNIIKITLLEGVILSLILSVITLFFSKEIAALYTPSYEVIATTQSLFYIVAMMLAIDVLVIACGFILRGLGDPSGPLIITALAHWGITIPLGYVLAFTDWIVHPMGTAGFWVALFLGLCAALVMMGFRLRKNVQQIPSVVGNS